jgi:Raf kinase inhibitor-like YbhB/YbcL family protein
MNITSSAFKYGCTIPISYTQRGEDSSPPLAVTDVPDEAKSLVLVVEDPDATKGCFTHWILFNINPKIGVILANDIPDGAVQGTNSAGTVGYIGPNPKTGTHRYFFNFYALSQALPLDEGVSRDEVEEALKGKIVAEAEYLGLSDAEMDYA